MSGSINGVFFEVVGQNVNIDFFQGKTITFPLVWGGTANPIDVSGYDAALQIRRTPTSDIIADFSVDNGRVTIGGANGLITFEMTAADSAELTPGCYVYEIEVTDASGNVMRAMSGKAQIVSEVVR